MKSKISLIVGVVAFLIGAYFLATKFYNKKSTENIKSLAKKEQTVFERPHSQTLGDPMARVTLVEFLDPECEACRMFSPYVKDILKEFKGSVRLVIRYAPFHGNSKFAVQLLEAAAKQGKYWETLDLFFEKQPEWGSHHAPKPDLLWGYLKDLNLNIEKIKKDMLDPEIIKNMEQDLADGAKLGVRRTPTFFVNGKPLERFGLEPLKELIRSELK